MSPEVCPFCGKSFKRLKSHLPHCKAAKTSKTSSLRHEETRISSSSASSTPSLPPLGPNQSPHTAKSEASTETTLLDTEGKEKLVKTPTTVNVAKKVKLKLSEKIKMAAESSSSASAVVPLASKGSKKIPRPSQIDMDSIYKENVDLFSNAKTQPKPKNTQEDTEKSRMDLENLKFDQTVRKSPKLKTPDVSQNDSKKERSHILTKKTISVKEDRVRTSRRDKFWSEEEIVDTQFPEDDVWASRRDTRIALSNVRGTLGRVKDNGSASVGPRREPPSQFMTSPGKSLGAPSQSPDFTSDLSKVENKDCSFVERADILKGGLQMDGHTMGLAALSSPARTFLEAEISTDAFQRNAAPFLKENVQKAKSVMEERGSDAVKRRERCGPSGAVSQQQRLGQVTLRELPDWLVSRSPRRPREALQMVQRGWGWYYRRYIDVKRGGVGGVAMLLAGYCVLSYIWAFPHLKHERWRKYH